MAAHHQLLADRIRSEFAEMPGMCLTLAQACRLWHIEASECAAALEALVSTGVLARTDDGVFVTATSAPRRRMARAALPYTFKRRPA